MFSGAPVETVWAFDSTDVWAGGPALVHWDGTSWTQFDVSIPAGSSVTSFWGFASDDLYALANGVLIHWDGTTWTSMTNTPFATVLYGSSANNLWLAGGQLGDVQRWDGGALTEAPFGTTVLLDLWGDGHDDVFAVGLGEVLEWEDTSTSHSAWAIDTLPSSVGRGGVWGDSASDMWVAGGPTLSHWNGYAWTRYGTPIDESTGKGMWRDVWGVTTNDVWAVTLDGVLWHDDGTGWAEEAHEDAFHPNAVRAATDGSVWMAGQSSADGFGVVFER